MYLKYCGFTRMQDVREASALNIDAIGFILYPQSARYVDLDHLPTLTEQVPDHIDRVAVTVNMPLSTVEQVLRKTTINTLQLHGEEPLEVVKKIRRCYPDVQLIKALSATHELEQNIKNYRPVVDKIIVDTPTEAYGGSGESFDWRHLTELSTIPVIVAGGLNLQNVTSLIDNFPHIAGLDVASGIEHEKGIKDLSKMTQIAMRVKGDQS
ncbi:phosphoribosylanthranilate isomerase [Staphylococcus chromogenes]|uniref:phosphoribosylanthranilate isomerase n=1 Tax=Staphylococcus chromogenes TaxID=46126 RepID=UPI000E6A729E|nr:phosphoribosylanthranilate isomerase [Staphylococcus chromogenes]MCE4966156.1 phosphoribosylanthranilate isomerase [Staphylococcus chromogenes]RIM07469.1 phosphoribosylanthranilate isomerase [Staphylococcus chromogenes]